MTTMTTNQVSGLHLSDRGDLNDPRLKLLTRRQIKSLDVQCRTPEARERRITAYVAERQARHGAQNRTACGLSLGHAVRGDWAARAEWGLS